MEAESRVQAERVLSRIPAIEWRDLLASSEGKDLRVRLDAVRLALGKSSGRQNPAAAVLDLYGYRLLSDRKIGPWVRQEVLKNLARTKWWKICDLYRDCAGKRAEPFHGLMGQRGKGSKVLADYWHQGSRWAAGFCELAGLPLELGETRRKPALSDEDVEPAEPLPPLHGFQIQVYRKLRRLLNNGLGKAAMLSLPKGAGKTRVAVEAICDHLAQEDAPQRKRNIVLWIAQSNELQEQAWECFRQVWEVPPQRRGESIRRAFPLRLIRAWGGRDPDEIQIGRDPAVLIASIDQLAAWTKRRLEFFESFPRRRLLCTIVDEAHSITTREHARVLAELGNRAKKRWYVRTDSAPLIGLTATPWRSRDREARTLQQFLQTRLLHPDSLGGKPVSSLQRQGILARVKSRRLFVKDTTPMNADQLRRFKEFREIPNDYLSQLGYDHGRNAKIVKALAKLPKRSRTLVFACSIAHAEILTMALNSACGPGSAALITGKTPRVERAALIERFRNGEGLRFLCNVGVFTVGFDAPKVNVVCVTRPTTSALRYEQMVGRGLRGPKNRGTSHCLVLDVQDKGLPGEIQSYARVLDSWEGGRLR